ncbi:MAG TPA: GMC family oxidoreductase [Actinomycetales bacterium]|nr:GMC family oxidoreductase [Actinomycetales bacterium]
MLLTTMSTDATGMAVAEQAGMTIKSYVVSPTTTSQIHISDPDPEAPPIIEASFLKTENDRQKAAALLRRQREFAASQPLVSLIEGEVAPGDEVQTHEDAVNYALATGAGLYHAVGSCAMGPRDDDVVDHRLRVRGIPGLRVADASIFSSPPASAMAAPTMAVGWRAADLLREES